MMKKINSFKLIKYIGNLINSKKSYERNDQFKNHTPSWMYRNE